MLKKPVASLVAKVKDADWTRPAKNAWIKITEYSKRAGREATRIVLRFYYALTDGDLSPKDKALVYAGIIYIVVPHDLLPKKTLGLLGLVDDAAVIGWVWKKVSGCMTPAVEQKVNDTLNDWFGYDVRVTKPE
ncbi:MAG: DUF1232 domain-containing protein [Bacteroidales bacterium]|nr:DUF1232 domain-containing protein [Bacteroidales bacterium]